MARIYPAAGSAARRARRGHGIGADRDLDGTAMPPGASSRSYRVYRAEIESGQRILRRIFRRPSRKHRWSLRGLRLRPNFAIRTLSSERRMSIPCEASRNSARILSNPPTPRPAIVTPRDVFPPAAPTSLEIAIVPATPQAPAYVELSWAISPEGDLAGYSVYRSEARRRARRTRQHGNIAESDVS